MKQKQADDGTDFAEWLRKDYLGHKVLLVEDDVVNQEIALALFEDTGLVIDVSENGLDAIGRIENQSYDLILMDMLLPCIDGLETTRRIRMHKRGANIPIVAVTANAFDADKSRCMEAGMNDFLSKPFNPDSLYRVVHRWLSGAGQA